MKELALKDIFFAIKSNLVSIIISMILVVISAYLYVSNISDVYRSDAIITLVDDNQSTSMSSLTSQFGGIAGMAGIQLPSNESSRKSPAYVDATIKSKKFFKHLTEFDMVLEGVFASKGYDIKENVLIYDQDIYESSSNKWVRNPPKNYEVIPSYLEAHPIFLMNLYTEVDKKTGFIYLSYEHHSPVFAKNIIELIFSELNSLSRSLEYEESQNAIIFYQDIAKNTQINNIRNSVNRLLELELQESMLASTKTNYLVEYIDNPVVPIKRIYPKKSLLMILITLFSFFIILFIILIKYFVFQFPKIKRDN